MVSSSLRFNFSRFRFSNFLCFSFRPWLPILVFPNNPFSEGSSALLLPTHSLPIHSSTLTTLPSLLRSTPNLGTPAPSSSTSIRTRTFMIASPNEPGKNIEMCSPQFYAHCTVVDKISAHGACKFGFYEFFKKYCSDLAGPEYFAKCKTLIYLAGSVSAEVIADVQVQGIVPLWGRQIPYTMLLFASFETIVEMIYKYGISAPKDQCSKFVQLHVGFPGGCIAGAFRAVVSHPADNLFSFLNNAKGATVGDAVKKLGLWGLFTLGLPLRILIMAPISSLLTIDQ